MKSLTSRSIKVFLVTCTPKHYISALKFCCRRRRCCCFNSGRHHRYHRPVVKIQLKTNRITIWKKKSYCSSSSRPTNSSSRCRRRSSSSSFPECIGKMYRHSPLHYSRTGKHLTTAYIGRTGQRCSGTCGSVLQVGTPEIPTRD